MWEVKQTSTPPPPKQKQNNTAERKKHISRLHFFPIVRTQFLEQLGPMAFTGWPIHNFQFTREPQPDSAESLLLFVLENQCDNIVLLLDSKVLQQIGHKLELKHSDSESWGKALSSLRLCFLLYHLTLGAPATCLIGTIASGVRSILLEVFFLYPDMPLGGKKLSECSQGLYSVLGPCHYYFKSYYPNEIGVNVI